METSSLVVIFADILGGFIYSIKYCQETLIKQYDGH